MSISMCDEDSLCKGRENPSRERLHHRLHILVHWAIIAQLESCDIYFYAFSSLSRKNVKLESCNKKHNFNNIYVFLHVPRAGHCGPVPEVPPNPTHHLFAQMTIFRHGRQGSPRVAKGFQGPRGTPGMGEMSYNQIDHI